MTEETQASLLADWLQSPPGTPAPEGLDTDVLAAVYSLRPDRAPPLRLTVEDILGSVREGPLAARTTAGLNASGSVGPPRKGATRIVAAGSNSRTPERRAPMNKAWWAVPGIGIVVTAAAAALIVVKVGVLSAPNSEEIARFSAPTAALDEPAGAPAGADPSPAAAPVSAPRAAAPLVASPPPPAAPPAGLAEGAPATEASNSTLGAEDRRERQSGIPEADQAPRPQEEGASGYFADAPVATPAPAQLEAAKAATTTSPAAGAGGTGTAALGPSRATAESALDKGDADLSRDDLNDEEMPVAQKKEAKSKDSARSAPPEPSAAAAAPASAAPSKSSAASSSTAASAGSATPFDYNPNFYTAYPEVSAAYGAAVVAQNGGRYADAVAAFAPFLAASRSDVAQDAAWRAARCLRSLGRLDDALTTVQAGLRRSSANTPFRSNLYVIQGELYSATGKPSDAQKAWAEAARLNDGR